MSEANIQNPGQGVIAIRFAHSIFTGMLLALLLVIIMGLGVTNVNRPVFLLPLVPPPMFLYVEEPPTNKPGEMEILSDFSRFDLRSWKPVPTNVEQAMSTPISPTNYSNYLRIVKRKPVKYFYAHYATSGARIDLQCNSHKYSVLTDQKDPFHASEGEKTFVIKADISNEPVGKSFVVIVEATYWNGFRNALTEDAATYTDSKGPIPENLSLLVLFPTNKPGRNLRLTTFPNDTDRKKKEIASNQAQLGTNGEYAYWNIKNQQPGYHYKMAWDWPETEPFTVVSQ